jgi:tetratricopeptide (TPR) repeat protein
MDGGSPFLRAKAVEAAGGIAWWQGDMDEADRLYVEALAMQRGLADRREIANAAYNAALTQAYGFQNGEAAGVLLREAEGIYRDLDDSGGLANVFWGQGSLAFLGGAGPSESRQLLEQAVKAYAAADNVFGEGWAHFELGALLTRLGSVDEAEPHLIDGLRLLWDSRDYSAVVMFMALFGWVSFQRDDRIRAVTLAGAAYALRDHSGVDLMSIEANRIEGMSIEDMEALDGEDAIAYERGRAMGYDEAVAFALREA